MKKQDDYYVIDLNNNVTALISNTVIIIISFIWHHGENPFQMKGSLSPQCQNMACA